MVGLISNLYLFNIFLYEFIDRVNVIAHLYNSKMFALFDRLREISENIFTNIEMSEHREAGDGCGDAAQLVVGEVQVLQSMTVEQWSTI